MNDGHPSPYSPSPTPRTALPSVVIGAPMLLQDHQPDIRFQGNNLRRALLRHRSEIAFIGYNIKLELNAMAATTDQVRWGQGRTWIIQAQKWRRAALANAIAHEQLIAKRDLFATLTGTRLP